MGAHYEGRNAEEDRIGSQDMTDFPIHRMKYLAERVVGGEAVFFVGAGFSIESEGNTAACLIRRLVARFLAMSEYLRKARGSGTEIKDRTHELITGLSITFQLRGKAGDPRSIASHHNIQSLARDYYHINDWICNAFGIVLGLIESLPELQGLNGANKIATRINRRENQILERLEKRAFPFERKGIALKPMVIENLLMLDARCRGKALFLDTMGFADEEVMAGRPMARQLHEVANSYGDRLLQRHHVLAWLAREGLSTTLVTTNYDLLLEGAYRLAGLMPCDSTAGSPNRLPLTSWESFARIANADQFFTYGYGHRTALIVKIHGCAEVYRKARERRIREATGGNSVRPWQVYLPAMVFTFREIQNWREDSWSRDYLRTLLRTRTLIFCGYSGVDPVLHDTFRTVYEEMADYRGRNLPVESSAGSRFPSPPAFFLGLAGRKEFHSMEILRAASSASGHLEIPLTEHPHYLPFWPRGDDHTRFPNLDELMLWLFHLVYRRRQEQALDTALRRIATLVLGHPCAETEVAVIKRNFRMLRVAELCAVRRWARDGADAADRREQFHRIVDWTVRFHPGVMRELALAEAVVCHQGPGFDLEKLRQGLWYFPTNDHPDWTAWGVVLELAVRRMIAVWRQTPDMWMHDNLWVRVGAAGHPTVFFARGGAAPTPACLHIRLASFDRIGGRPVAPGVTRWESIWRLEPDGSPWPVAPPTRRGERRRTPSAEKIWQWAQRDLSVRIPANPTTHSGQRDQWG